MRGKEMGDIGMLKGGLLAWLLWQGGVVVDIVDHRGNIGLGVYRREEGEETGNIIITILLLPLGHISNITNLY